MIPKGKLWKNNGNLWAHAPEINRELRKCRWKHVDIADMDRFPLNDYEEYTRAKEYKHVYGTEGYDPWQEPVNMFHYAPEEDLDFRRTIEQIAHRYLSPRETKVVYAWIFLGLRQQEIADMVGVSQTLVNFDLKAIKTVMLEHYYKGRKTHCPSS